MITIAMNRFASKKLFIEVIIFASNDLNNPLVISLLKKTKRLITSRVDFFVSFFYFSGSLCPDMIAMVLMIALVASAQRAASRKLAVRLC